MHQIVCKCIKFYVNSGIVQIQLLLNTMFVSWVIHATLTCNNVYYVTGYTCNLLVDRN